MSARARLPRKSAASPVTYADAHTSCSDSDGDEGAAGGGAAKRAGPSKRSKGKARAVDSDDADGGDEDEAPRKKARKVTKGGGKARKKGEGKLEVLKTLPVELLVEIFSHLDPNDLLALSMVNKQCRALLTANSSARLWKDARQRLDLTDVSACGFTEWQYAHLMFGKHCFVCNAKTGTITHVSLRSRLCKRRCAELLVNISGLDRTHPDLMVHPLTHKCVPRTPTTADGWYWGEPNPQYAFLAEVLKYSSILYELQAQAEDSGTGEEDGLEAATYEQRLSGLSTRPRRQSSQGRVTYYGLDQEEHAGAVMHARRVSEFVDARIELLASFYKDASALGLALWHARCQRSAQEQDRRVKDRTNRLLGRKKEDERIAAIQDRVLRLDLGFDEDDFCGAWTTDKLVNNTNELDDDEWSRIKTRVLKLLDRVRKKRLVDAHVNLQQARQISLRHRYDKLKDSLPTSARPFVPLFVDFLLLPSVKELWEPEDAVVNRATWSAQLDAIIEELAQHRLAIVEHAHELVMSATTDPDERGRADDEEDEPDLTDAFFSRATSFVCCGIKGCFSPQNSHYVWTATSWTHMPHPNEDRKGAIGTLIQVLQHQHDKHNIEDHISQPKRFAAAPEFRIELPLEIACAMSAVLDLVQLDPRTAGHKELERADRNVLYFEWENSPVTKRICRGRPAWFYLCLCFVKYQGDKRAAMKPPLPLDPPCLVLHAHPP
ncbi:hypothetical protein JCM3770_003338 [Rhodotorula araucariae]